MVITIPPVLVGEEVGAGGVVRIYATCGGYLCNRAYHAPTTGTAERDLIIRELILRAANGYVMLALVLPT